MTELEEINIKCELFAQGISIEKEAMLALNSRDAGRPVTFAEFATTNGIILKFSNKLWVNAPLALYNPNLVHNSKWSLHYKDSTFIVRNDSSSYEIEVIPTPIFPHKYNSRGIQFKEYAITHADRLRVSPIYGCAFDCKFCDVNLIEKDKYIKYSQQDIFEAIDAAKKDEVLPAKHMLISGGTPKPKDREYLTDLCEAVIRKYPDFNVDVMATPDGKSVDFPRLAKAGMHGASINIEIYDAEIAKKIMPRKAKATLGNRWKTIEDVVKELPDWRVRSLIIVGLEPMASVIEGVTEMCKRGIMPVLSPFRPHPETVMRDVTSPTANEMLETYLRCAEVAAKYNTTIGPTCVPCQHNAIAIGTDKTILNIKPKKISNKPKSQSITYESTK